MRKGAGVKWYKRKEGDRERREEERKGGENEVEGEKGPGAHSKRNMLKTGPSHMLPRAQADWGNGPRTVVYSL